MEGWQSFYASIVLMVLLFTALSQSISVTSFPRNLVPAIDGGVLQAGSFAVYIPSNLSLQYLLGYGQASGASASNQLQALNKTTFDYSLKEVSWKVDELSAEYIKINYTIEFVNSNAGQAANPVALSEKVLVSMENASLYAINGTYIGQWPYWLPSSLSIGRNVTFLHNYQQYGCNYAGSCGAFNVTPVEFLSLPLGNGIPASPSSSSSFVDASLVLPSIGTFKSDRLIVSYPYLTVNHCNTIADCEEGLFNSSGPAVIEGIPTPNWVAVYDRFSGIMLALQHDDWFVDDIMLHSGLGIWHIGFESASLLLTTTTVQIRPDSQMGIGASTLYPFVASGIVISITIISTVYLWRRRNHRVRSKYSREKASRH